MHVPFDETLSDRERVADRTTVANMDKALRDIERAIQQFEQTSVHSLIEAIDRIRGSAR